MDLINYFDGENSVCREERQYALFLYIKGRIIPS